MQEEEAGGYGGGAKQLDPDAKVEQHGHAEGNDDRGACAGCQKKKKKTKNQKPKTKGRVFSSFLFTVSTERVHVFL